MIIIKKGDIQKMKKIVRFECRNCGCIFEAEKGEYKIDSQYNDEYYSCECPFCHKQVTVG